MKINVVGTSGTGKTTFGKQLAEILMIPFIEMDALYWGPDWTGASDEELYSRLTEALIAENWVLDGNYSRTEVIKWKYVEDLIWLDFSFPRTIYQAVTRAIPRLFSQEELWPGTGNRESLRMLLSRDSIVLWTIQTYGRRKKKYLELMKTEEYSHLRFHRIRSPGQAIQLLQKLKQDPDYLTTRSLNHTR